MPIFVVIVAVTIGLGQWYLWWRLVRSTTRPGRARRVGTIVMVVLGLLPIGAVSIQRAGIPEWVGLPITWVGYLWLASMLYLGIALAVLEIPRYVATRRARRTPADHDEPQASEAPLVNRRLAIARGIAVTAGVAAAGTVTYGVTQAVGTPKVKMLDVGLAKLPADLDGLRVAVISDLHVGEINGRDFVADVVARINAQNPHVVAICGDLADGSVALRGEMVEPLQDLKSTFGSFFVTGNHEYFGDAEAWIDFLPDIGVNVLHNRRVDLNGLDLAGVDDLSSEDGSGPAHYAQALDGRDSGKPVVLMAHQPVQVEQAEAMGVDLQLSGHTHGGQLWPFNYVVGAQQGYVAGLHRVGGTQLYVTRGAGFWGPPVRVGAPPDISLLTLRSD